jgi:epoxyqueuosine reductase QueG
MFNPSSLNVRFERKLPFRSRASLYRRHSRRQRQRSRRSRRCRAASAAVFVNVDAGFSARLSVSPIKCIGRDRFVRNCRIAASHSGEAGLLVQVGALRADPDLIVAERAAWPWSLSAAGSAAIWK